jgi:hypothetical protein
MLLAVLLTLHSWSRWAVVASTLAMGVCSTRAWIRRTPWTPLDASLTRTWVGTVDLQVALGFVLYFAASPMASIARQDFRAAWSDETLRFFGILHPAAMVLVLVSTHATRVWANRTEHEHERFRRLTLGVLATFVIAMLAIPWPFLPYGRPLTRM